MKRYTLLFILFLTGFITTNAKANIFASAVEIDYTGSFPAYISYSLNQEATSVDVIIKDYPAGNIVKTITVTTGNGVFLGYNDVEWDGSLDAGGTATSGIYTIEIIAKDDEGSDGYELISYETGPDSWYWSPAGVVANKRQTSPYFGMVYVTERSGGTSSRTGAGETKRGLYMHDSYGKYYGGQLLAAYAGGNNYIDWDAMESYAPYGVTIGPDDRVYTFVLTKGNITPKQGGVAVGDPLYSTDSVTTVLSFDHDPISDVLVVGLGAERTMYTVEQTSQQTGADNDSPTDGGGYKSSHIMKYALGEAIGEYTAAGEEVIPTSVLPLPFRIAMDSEGYLYVVQQVYDSLAVADSIYGLSKWDISGAAPAEVWHIALDQAPAHRDSAVHAHGADATNFDALALDEAHGIVYTARRKNARPYHNVIAYDMETGALLGSFASAQSISGTDTTDLSGGGGNNIRDINIDAAGNIAVVNSSFEALRIFSPPDGANSFTTFSPMAINAGVGTVPTPEDVTAIETSGNSIPMQYSLAQNYPNPFNPSTVIEFSIPQKQFVTLKIYTIAGREISTIVNNNLSAGSYKMNFNAARLAAGVYFYRITAGKFTSTKKMMLLK